MESYQRFFVDSSDEWNLECLKCRLIWLFGRVFEKVYADSKFQTELQELKEDFLSQIHPITCARVLYSLGKDTLTQLLSIIAKGHCASGNRLLIDAYNYITDHLEDDLSLTEVANALEVSKNHLSSLFIKEEGKGYAQIVMELRIEKAKQLLFQTRLNITEIAFQCGFNSVSYFSSSFKKVTGQPPLRFRSCDHSHTMHAECPPVEKCTKEIKKLG